MAPPSRYTVEQNKTTRKGKNDLAFSIYFQLFCCNEKPLRVILTTHTQRKSLMNTTTNAFTIPSPVFAHLPDYGDLDFSLPELKSLFREPCRNNQAAIDAFDSMSLASKELFNLTLISVCGWSVDTLTEMAEDKAVDWVDLFYSEMETDEENPFKETGIVMLQWNSASPTERAEADVAYERLTGKTMSQALNSVIDAVMDHLDTNPES
jgi:hypothetical protein